MPSFGEGLVGQIRGWLLSLIMPEEIASPVCSRWAGNELMVKISSMDFAAVLQFIWLALNATCIFHFAEQNHGIVDTDSEKG